MKKIAEVMLCKCPTTGKTFGIRVEKIDFDLWLQTWAFPVDEMIAKREGYKTSLIIGKITSSNDYPGCPYCGSRNWIHCGNCNNLTDDNHGAVKFKCGWCGKEGRVGGRYDGSGIKGVGDR